MYKTVQGMTEPIKATLLADGSPQLLVGLTVTIEIYDNNGVLQTNLGTFTVIDDGTAPLRGQVQYKPADGELQGSKSPYKVRYVAEQVSTDTIVKFPNLAADTWIVEFP